MRNLAPALSFLALSALLAGCSGTSTPEPPEEQGPLGKVASIDELVDAYVDAGGTCDWERNDRVTLATASGECSSNSVLMTFATRDAREEIIGTQQALKMDGRPLTLLVGENWIVNAQDAIDVRETLGGEYITE